MSASGKNQSLKKEYDVIVAGGGFQAAMQEHCAEIRGDIANYTDIAQTPQVNEIVVERSDR